MLFSCLFMVYNDDILSIFLTFHVCARIFFQFYMEYVICTPVCIRQQSYFKTAVPLVLRQFCSPAYLLHKTQHSKDAFVYFYWNFGRSAFDFSLQIPISLFLSPNGRLPGGRPS